MPMPATLERALQERRALKVISGLMNFDAEKVAKVVRAAELGGATFVDIACDPALVHMVRNLVDLPICVSAVEPEAFVEAVEAGADMVEIGNYDAFYAEGRIFSAEEVLELTRATRALLPEITLSVTVPHTLSLDAQAELAEALEAAGADLIQTEGGTSSSPEHAGVLGLIEKAAPTLAAAATIAKVVNIPVLCASGLSDVTAPMAIAAGAQGVGVGSAINRLNDDLAMVAAVKRLSESLERSAARV
jgi:predicted transcriptional regulator